MLNDPFRNLKLPDDVISKLLDRGPKICHICACLLNPENAVARRPSSDSDIEADNRLRRTLSSFRREAAEGKPAYFVFDNRSIDELVRIRPTSPSELSTIHGFGGGGVKLRNYGETILAIISGHEEGKEEDIGEHDKLFLACNICSRGGPPDPLPSEQRTALEGPPPFPVVDPRGKDTIIGRIVGHIFIDDEFEGGPQ